LAFWTRKSDGICLVKVRYPADYIGREQVLGFFQKSMELSGGTLRIELHDIVASDMAVFVLCTVSATRSGQHAGFLAVHVWRVFDGRAVEFREFQGDEATEGKFWAQSPAS
jgi:hypothetical protein